MGLISLAIAGFISVGVLIYVATIYNGRVALRNDRDKAWANIEVVVNGGNDAVGRLVEV